MSLEDVYFVFLFLRKTPDLRVVQENAFYECFEDLYFTLFWCFLVLKDRFEVTDGFVCQSFFCIWCLLLFLAYFLPVYIPSSPVLSSWIFCISLFLTRLRGDFFLWELLALLFLCFVGLFLPWIPSLCHLHIVDLSRNHVISKNIIVQMIVICQWCWVLYGCSFYSRVSFIIRHNVIFLWSISHDFVVYFFTKCFLEKGPLIQPKPKW